MAQEIERKFLLRELPVDLDHGSGSLIRQAYLCLEEDREVRIRAQDKRRELTYKRGAGVVRDEINIPLDASQFEQLWSQTKGRRLEKTRYLYSYAGFEFELDVYGGELAPLMVAELEFDSEEAAQRFQPPSFLSREISSETVYKNSRLAMQGKPQQEAT